MAAARAPASPARHESTVSPSRPGHLRQRPAVGRHQCGAGDHRLDGRQAEPLVEARHDGELGLCVELDDGFVGDAGDEVDVLAEPERADEVHALSVLRLADDRQRHVTFGAQLGHRLQQVGQALQRHVGRGRGDQASRHSGDVRPRPEEVRVDADWHEAHALVVDAHVVVDVTDRVLADHDDARQPRGDPTLHLDERVPPADREALAPVRRVVHLQAAVLGDRVVQRDDRRDQLLQAEDPVAEALVVVHQVELADPRPQRPQRPIAERQRLAERPGRELRQFEQVLAGLDLPVGGEAAGVVVVEEVQARQLDERDALVEDRVRLTAQHLDVVAEVDEGLGEVPGVDALAAHVRLATVGEVGDAQRRVRFPGRRRRHGGPRYRPSVTAR